MRPWPVVVLLIPLLAGCAQEQAPEVTPPDVGYDPSTVRPTGYRKAAETVQSFDGTELATVVYTPLTSDTLPDGSAPRWPVVVFLHGWGLSKEQFEGTEAVQPGARPPSEAGAPAELGNILAGFAANGILAVAYDARGFGRSGGTSTVAGPAEAADLSAVITHVQDNYDAGRIGVVGVSYGAGQALLAWADDPRIETAAAVFGWIDLYDAVLPGNVPKLAWANLLFGLGAAGSGGAVHPMLADWYRKALQREDLETLRMQMDARSVGQAAAATDKPLLVCQGLQESLMPQAADIAATAGGFTRTYIYEGGHEFMDAGCLERIRSWMQFFLGGFPTGVASWPELETADAGGSDMIAYDTWPTPEPTVLYARAPDLVAGPSPERTFTIRQQPAGNPFSEPALVGDLVPPAQAIPEALRRDPGALDLMTAPFAEAGVLVGTPEVHLVLADNASTPWQVTAQLLHVNAAGDSRILTRSAYAAVQPEHVDNGTVTLRFPFTKADLEAGDRLQLRLASNDPSWWMPLLADYTVTFTGESRIELPIL